MAGSLDDSTVLGHLDYERQIVYKAKLERKFILNQVAKVLQDPEVLGHNGVVGSQLGPVPTSGPGNFQRLHLSLETKSKLLCAPGCLALCWTEETW